MCEQLLWIQTSSSAASLASAFPPPVEKLPGLRGSRLCCSSLGRSFFFFFLYLIREMLAWPPLDHRSVRRVRSWTRRRLWPGAARGDQTSCLAMGSPSAIRTATGSASSCTGAATWAGVTVSLFYLAFNSFLYYHKSIFYCLCGDSHGHVVNAKASVVLLCI